MCSIENVGGMETLTNHQVPDHLLDLIYNRGSMVSYGADSLGEKPKLRNKLCGKKQPLLAPRPVKILDQPIYLFNPENDEWTNCLESAAAFNSGHEEDIQTELNKIFCGTSHSSFDCFDNSYGVGTIGPDSFDAIDDHFGWPHSSNHLAPIIKYDKNTNLDDLPKLGKSPKPAINEYSRPPSRAPNPFQCKNGTEKLLDEAMEMQIINDDTISPPPFRRNRSCSEPVIFAPIHTNYVGL